MVFCSVGLVYAITLVSFLTSASNLALLVYLSFLSAYSGLMLISSLPPTFGLFIGTYNEIYQ